MNRRRYVEKFESMDGLISYTFPLNRYELVNYQPLRSPRTVVSGRDYAFRGLGTARSLKDVAEERIRCLIIGDKQQQDIEAVNAKISLYQAAYGKIWFLRYDFDDAQVREWAEGELGAMPEISLASDFPFTPLVASLNRFTDLFAETQIDTQATITSTGQTFTVTNPGLDYATRCIITVDSVPSAGFNHFKVKNNTTGDEFENLRVAAATSDIVRLDTIRPAIEFWTGAAWVSDFSNYVKPPQPQARYSFRLAPGSNTIAVTSGGTVNCIVRIVADAPVG